jgi:GNAT superfamily N-acetyltransferase
VHVRDARPEDFESVSRLLEELGRPTVLGTEEERERRDDYEAWLKQPGLFAWVAVGDDEGPVVGFIDMQLVPRLNFASPQAWVPDLIVTDGARSRGAGALLLAKAEEVARANGAFALTLESAHWRTRAHAFYLREGMTDGGKEFLKVLGDVRWPPPAPSPHAQEPPGPR